MPENNCTFEDAMARLNEIVKTLEKGDSPLNESLALFEEGAGLVAACQKVVKLRKGPGGEPEETPFLDEAP